MLLPKIINMNKPLLLYSINNFKRAPTFLAIFFYIYKMIFNLPELPLAVKEFNKDDVSAEVPLAARELNKVAASTPLPPEPDPRPANKYHDFI